MPFSAALVEYLEFDAARIVQPPFRVDAFHLRGFNKLDARIQKLGSRRFPTQSAAAAAASASS